jgi:5-(carboxyamino)imidazole ribonucleotide mutase
LELRVADLDVLVLMGSLSDWKHLQGAVDVLRKLELTFEVRVSSAHRTPERTIELIRRAETDGCQAFICAAGMAAHLAGVVAAHTTRPVLGVPLPGGVLDGVDALLSTVQMPSGIPVATFAVGSAGAKNAAFFAAQIVAAGRPAVQLALAEARQQGAAAVLEGDGEIRKSVDAGVGD